MIRRMCERLSVWCLSCLLAKVRALWGGCVSISHLDSTVPSPAVLHSLSVSLSYFLSIFYQFQSITIPVALLLSSWLLSQIISYTFPFSFLASAQASLCLLSTTTYPSNPNSCLYFLLISLKDKWHGTSQSHTLSLSLLPHLPNSLIQNAAHDRRKERTVPSFFVICGNNLRLM